MYLQVLFLKILTTKKKTLPGHIPGKVFCVFTINPHVRPRMVGRCMDHLNSLLLGIQQYHLIRCLTTYFCVAPSWLCVFLSFARSSIFRLSLMIAFARSASALASVVSFVLLLIAFSVL